MTRRRGMIQVVLTSSFCPPNPGAVEFPCVHLWFQFWA